MHRIGSHVKRTEWVDRGEGKGETPEKGGGGRSAWNKTPSDTIELDCYLSYTPLVVAMLSLGPGVNATVSPINLPENFV